MLGKALKAIVWLGKVLLVVVGGPILAIIMLLVWNMDWSRDDQLMQAFKAPLVTFLESGAERVTLEELYGGTEFAGDALCVNYLTKELLQHKEDLAASPRLNRLFPDMAEEIAGVRLTQKGPNLLVAIRRGEKILAMSGDIRLFVAKRDVFGLLRVERISSQGGVGDRFIARKNGSRCVDFKQGVFKRDAYISKTSKGDTLWLSAVLTDSESPTQDEMEAAQQLRHEQKAKAAESVTPQPDTSPQ